MSRAVLACAALAAVVAGAGASARANPADMFGYGARGQAMGGAQVAAVDDGSANYYNPAALARLDAVNIAIGYQLAHPTLEVDDRDVDVDLSRGIVASIAAPGELGGMRVALGGAVFVPDQQITRTRTLNGQQPRFVYYDNRGQRLFLAANLAMQITDWLWVGGGLAYMSSTKGDVFLRGRVGFPDADDSDLELGIDVDLESIRYGQAGALVRLRDWLDVGVTFRSQFVLTLDQAFVITGDVGPSGAEPVVEDGYLALSSVSQDHFQPAQLVVGARAHTDAVTVGFDVAYHRWSAFDNPAADIVLDLDVGDFNDLVDIPPSPPLPPPSFHDIIVPRLGVEWAATRAVAVRGGYVYEPTPVPDQFDESNFIDNDKHTLSGGLGYTLDGIGDVIPRPVSFDVAIGVTVLADRDTEKLDPVDPVGDYRSDGWVLSASVTSRWRF